MVFTAQGGTRVRVHVFPSLGGNLFLLFRASIAVLDQGSTKANLHLAMEAWKSAAESTQIPPK